MSQATTFVFDTYTVDSSNKTLTFRYHYIFDDGTTLPLNEVLTIPADLVETEVTTPILRALHLGLGISYYKIFLAPTIDVPYLLNPKEADFWNMVYLNGLGEFLYTNKLPAEKLAKFEAKIDSSELPPSMMTEKRAILGLGGGKDSVVAGELLKTIGVLSTAFVLGTGDVHGQTEEVAKLLESDILGVKRVIDQQIIELNKRPDAFNGHIPISLIFALVGTLLAILTKTRFVIVANEAASSIPNTEHDGMSINHQWSKSFEFESAFQTFLKECINTDIYFFSAIRPLTSVGVMKIFSQFPKYFEAFTSCNRVFVMDPEKRPNGRWCGVCAKDLSTFILLAPWVSEEDMLRIFGKNLLDDPELEKLFLELAGAEGHRPLDCVGTADEILLSLNRMARDKKFENTKLMQVARDHSIIKEDNWDEKLQDALKLQDEYQIPTDVRVALLDEMTRRLAL